MENSVAANLHCEEGLRTTLYCDDTEKLRRMLGKLQRKYDRTAQRLEHAERLHAVRGHVRSRITQQNHQDQRDPDVTCNPCLNPSSLTLNSTSTAPDAGSADCHSSKMSQVIRFQLPSDAACPQTPDPSHDVAGGQRSSPAMRLRSRRSRQRWERRNAEAGRITGNSEEGQEGSERMEPTRLEREEEKVKSKETDVVNESEEVLSASESESPSLLLTHWSTHANSERVDMEGKEMQAYQGHTEKESKSRADGKKESQSASVHTEESRQDCTSSGGRKETEGGEDGKSMRESEIRPCEENSNKDTEKTAAEKIENEQTHDNTTDIKEERTGMEGDGKSVAFLDSCTLVEGLLFPAEYYVRTTRRMTASQSQPDLQAIINSQLSMKQRRRSRGHSRGRGLNRNTHSSDCSAQHTQTYSSSQNPASVDPHKLSHMQAAGASSEPSGNNQSSSEISEHACPSQTNTDAFSSPTVCATRPGRGRRRKRGRGRGRPQIPRSFLNLDLGHTSDCSQAASTLVSSSPSLHVAHGSKPSLASQEDVPVTHKPEPAPVYITATQPSSGINGAQDNSGSGHLEKVCPIFVKSSTETKRSSQRSIGTASWQSLLLPSSPAQTSLCPLRFQPPGLLVSNLRNLDIHQDFYLPDDQFALLKLLKLRQITVELGVEQFTSPSYNTRSSTRRSNICWTSSNDALIPFPLLLSLTPTDFTVEKPSTTQSAGVQNLFIDDKHASQSLVEGTSDQDTTETPGGQQTENLQAKTLTSSAESVSLVEDCAADCVSQYKEHETVTLNSHNESGLSASSTHTSVDHPVKPCLNFVDRPAGKVNDSVTGQSDYLKIKQPALEKQPDCADVVHPLENLREHNTVIIDCPLEQTPDEPSNSYNVKSPAKDSKGPCKPTHSPPIDKSAENKTQEKCVLHHIVPSQLLLSPPVASAPCPFLTPHLLSSALPSSPTLPSLGVTPVTPATSSSTSPRCTLPPAHSPSTQALSPQALSPCPSFMPLPTSQPPDSPSSQNQASLQPPDIIDQCYRVQMATCPTVSSIQAQGSGRLLGPRTEETTKKHMLRCIHTLKAPAGDCLVDACCLAGHSGGLYVAAAGKWAVCLWSQVSANDWSLIHSWSFNKPVINVFPVPDAAGLLCVTLGQLEISEVRMLSCSSFLQVLLYEGGVQAVVSVSKSRVVTSSHSAIGSTMKVFYLSDSNSMPSSQPLVSPGVCIGALAPVEELSDALIGTDECGRLFIWNLKTGQLLQKIILGDDLSHTACLRGYSYCGVLFVLLQHQFLSSLEEEETEAKAKDEMFSDEGKEEERKKTALFSLVTVNPLSGKSVLATQLSPPKAWSGSRLCEADVNSSSVVGLSQSGCMCVWELGRQGASEMVRAPESEGWQLARWGVRDVLLTGHHNGDVSLHCYSTCQASLCN